MYNLWALSIDIDLKQVYYNGIKQNNTEATGTAKASQTSSHIPVSEQYSNNSQEDA